MTGEQGQCLQHLRCSRPPGVEHKWMGTRRARDPLPPGSWCGRMAGLHTHTSLPRPQMQLDPLPGTLPWGTQHHQAQYLATACFTAVQIAQVVYLEVQGAKVQVLQENLKQMLQQEELNTLAFSCAFGGNTHTRTALHTPCQAQDTRALGDREATRDSHLHPHL